MQSSHHRVTPSFPLWQFLTQPLFTSTKVILNPIQFWSKHNVQYLEQCWNYDSMQLLERCWVKELELGNPSDQCIQK